jgi:transcriptional regulator with XRE-family HTH domain
MNNLRTVRFFHNLTQNQLSRLTNIDQSSISRLEREAFRDTPATQRMKEKICKVLEKDLQEVFPGAEEKEM